MTGNAIRGKGRRVTSSIFFSPWIGFEIFSPIVSSRFHAYRLSPEGESVFHMADDLSLPVYGFSALGQIYNTRFAFSVIIIVKMMRGKVERGLVIVVVIMTAEKKVFALCGSMCWGMRI